MNNLNKTNIIPESNLESGIMMIDERIMNTRDLRIGDKVLYDGLVYEITQLNDLSARILRNGYGRLVLSGELEPIQITDELLEKLCFEKKAYACEDTNPEDNLDYYIFNIGDYEIVLDLGDVVDSYDGKCNIQIDKKEELLFCDKISYLHELQHLLWDAKVEINTINKL